MIVTALAATLPFTRRPQGATLRTSVTTAPIRAVLAGALREVYNMRLNEQFNKAIVNRICELLDELRPSSTGLTNDYPHVKDLPGHDRRYASMRADRNRLGFARPRPRDASQTSQGYLDTSTGWPTCIARLPATGWQRTTPTRAGRLHEDPALGKTAQVGWNCGSLRAGDVSAATSTPRLPAAAFSHPDRWPLLQRVSRRVVMRRAHGCLTRPSRIRPRESINATAPRCWPAGHGHALSFPTSPTRLHGASTARARKAAHRPLSVTAAPSSQ